VTDVSTKTRFTTVQRVLHWLMAIGILAMLFIGVGMVSTIGRQYVPLLLTHKTLGIAILVLALVRLAVRFISGAPRFLRTFRNR
jgi:cytochrome b561